MRYIQKMWSAPTWIRLTLPLVVVFATGLAFPLPTNFGSDVAFRPPKAAFGVAWSLLLVLVGLAWAFATSELRPPTQDILFSVLLLTLIGFSVAAHYKAQRGVVWVTYGAMGAALVVLASLDTLGRTLMAPLVAWLVFASQLAQAKACTSCARLA
jgi:tryptophan-rich sensory protein